MAEPFYLTTAINYPNGPPHIGHAYEAVAADVVARFHRSMGREVFFQTGTDEHGLNMAQAARERGISPGRLADDAMTSALRAALPDADAEEIGDLAKAGQGSPGRALAWRGLDVAALDKAMTDLLRHGDPDNGRRSALAQSLALKSAQPRYEAFLARAPSLIAAEARARRGEALGEAVRLWERASSLAAGARGLSLEPESVVFELAGMLASLAPSR